MHNSHLEFLSKNVTPTVAVINEPTWFMSALIDFSTSHFPRHGVRPFQSAYTEIDAWLKEGDYEIRQPSKSTKDARHMILRRWAFKESFDLCSKAIRAEKGARVEWERCGRDLFNIENVILQREIRPDMIFDRIRDLELLSSMLSRKSRSRKYPGFRFRYFLAALWDIAFADCNSSQIKALLERHCGCDFAGYMDPKGSIRNAIRALGLKRQYVEDI